MLSFSALLIQAAEPISALEMIGKDVGAPHSLIDSLSKKMTSERSISIYKNSTEFPVVALDKWNEMLRKYEEDNRKIISFSIVNPRQSDSPVMTNFTVYFDEDTYWIKADGSMYRGSIFGPYEIK